MSEAKQLPKFDPYNPKSANQISDTLLRANLNIGKDGNFPSSKLNSAIFDMNRMVQQQYGYMNALGQVNPQYQQYFDSLGRTPGLNDVIELSGPLSPYNFIDARYVVHAREIEKIDQTVARVLRAVSIAPRIFPTIDVGRGRTKYLHYENQDSLDPVMSTNLKTYQPGVEAFTEYTKYMIGVHKDYEMGMLELDASRLSDYLADDVLTRTIAEFTALVGIFKERICWRGGDILTGNQASAIDDNHLGIVTDTTNIKTITPTNSDMTTNTRILDLVIEMTAELITRHFPLPYKLVITPGVFLQAMKNRNAYSDWSELKNLGELGYEKYGTPILDAVHWTPNLLKVAETTTTGHVYLIAPFDQAGRPNQVIAESYPLWHYPMNLSTQLGLSGKIAWYGAGIIRRQHSVIDSGALTTNVIA